jgi:hypothetical protein
MDVIIPDDVVEELRQLSDDSDGAQLRVGDYLCAVVDEFGHVVKRSEIIRQLANRTGRDTSTYRDRETVCRVFPPNIRAEYDGFTYSHWRALKRAGDNWRAYADLLAGDISMPVSVLRTRIANNGALPPAWVGRWSRVQELSEALAGDEQAPPGVRLTARLISMGILG